MNDEVIIIVSIIVSIIAIFLNIASLIVSDQ